MLFNTRDHIRIHQNIQDESIIHFKLCQISRRNFYMGI